MEYGYRYTHDRLQQVIELIWSIHCDCFGTINDLYNNSTMPRPMIYKFIQYEDFEN